MFAFLRPHRVFIVSLTLILVFWPTVARAELYLPIVSSPVPMVHLRVANGQYQELTKGTGFSGITEDTVVKGVLFPEIAQTGEIKIVPAIQFEMYGDYYVTVHFRKTNAGQEIARVTLGSEQDRLRFENIDGIVTAFKGEAQLVLGQADEAISVEIWQMRQKSENGVQFVELRHGATVVWIKSHGENLWLEMETPDEPLDWGLVDHLLQRGYMPTIEEMEELGFIFGSYLDN